VHRLEQGGPEAPCGQGTTTQLHVAVPVLRTEFQPNEMFHPCVLSAQARSFHFIEQQRLCTSSHTIRRISIRLSRYGSPPDGTCVEDTPRRAPREMCFFPLLPTCLEREGSGAWPVAANHQVTDEPTAFLYPCPFTLSRSLCRVLALARSSHVRVFLPTHHPGGISSAAAVQ
jgi:hypothetical protein